MISQISLQIWTVEKLVLEKKLIFDDSSWFDVLKFELEKTQLTSNLIIDLVFYSSRQNKEHLSPGLSLGFRIPACYQ